jgi:uncharacterized repeat protein (TIGR02543 family)
MLMNKMVLQLKIMLYNSYIMHNKNTILVSLAIFFLAIIIPKIAHANFIPDAGSGTSNDPYIVSTCAGLQSINDEITTTSGASGIYFKLGSDIDCNVAPYNTGNEFTPIGAATPFEGDFNGNGHSISGLHINTLVSGGIRNAAGLFGETDGASIYNVGIENIDIEITGPQSTIINAGALVSEPTDTDIHDTYATGTINVDASGSGIAEIGGLVGLPEGTTSINHSYSTVAVTVTGSGGDILEVGGLSGHNNSSLVVIKNSFATVFPVLLNAGGSQSGGLVGNNSSTAAVTNGYSVGTPLVGDPSNGTNGGQILTSFYETDPLHAVYDAGGSDPWDFTNTWGFADLSSLPVLSIHGLLPINHTLSFDAQGGSMVSDSTVAGGASATLPSAPARNGYDFEGWNTASDGSGTSYAAGATYTMPSGDITLYATWQAAQQGYVSGGGPASGCADSKALNYNPYAASLPALCVYPVQQAAVPISSSTAVSIVPSVRDLRLGLTGDDVRNLQKVLNANGFALAQNGPGSAGYETDKFGALTSNALRKYQAAHGVTATGYFGPLTRAQMKAAGVQELWW